MYGWRARIGRIAPSAATVAENEWAAAAPAGVITVCARTYIEEVKVANLERMLQDVERAAKEVASARVDVIAQCGTPAVFIKGFGFDRELIARLEELTGLPCTTMATSVVAALKQLAVRRVAVGTAYTADLNVKLGAFLRDSDFEVTQIAGLGLVRNVEIGDQGPEVAYRLGRRVVKEAPPSDALLISCAGLRTFEAIAPLEEDLGIPVVTSSQATFWHCLRLAGVRARVEGYGRLLAW